MTIIVDQKSITSYQLEYNRNPDAIFDEEKRYSATTNTIVAEANATYTIGLTADGSSVSGISMNGATIVVGTTTNVGTYPLRITASPTSTNYKDTITADITITVNKKDIGSYEFGYNTTDNATFGTEKTYTVTTTIPAGANVVYTIGLSADETAVPGISISQEMLVLP